MASAALYDAVVSFLDGDSGDVRTTVNAEFAGVMVTGSVTASRLGKTVAPRREKPTPLTVEIVPRGPWASRVVGIGTEELDLVFDLKCTLTQKDTSPGKNQLPTVEHVARSLIRRYRGVTNLTVPVSGGLGTFRRSNAALVAVDEVPESATFTRSVVRVTFTFTEAQAANA